MAREKINKNIEIKLDIELSVLSPSLSRKFHNLKFLDETMKPLKRNEIKGKKA